MGRNEGMDNNMVTLIGRGNIDRGDRIHSSCVFVPNGNVSRDSDR
jgi:hypothetical protein